MINRDFTSSGKKYIAQNKIALIVIAAILAIGAVILGVFGFKAGADVSGCNTFTITMGETYKQDKLKDYTSEINLAIADNKGELSSVQITGEGDSTTLVVKYIGKVKNIDKLNAEIAKELGVDISAVSTHSKIGANVTSKDYIYTIAGGLIILTLAAMFIALRYNLACTITAIGSSLLGVALLMAITGIFRLTINSSFLAINIITMLLILGENFMLFDTLEKEREKLKNKKDRSKQVENSLKAGAFRQKFMYGALFALALMFVILMPSTIKQASLILMFAVVVTMFITVFAIPFLWCLTITQVSDKIRVKKVEKKAKQTVEQVEGELENNYTENRVIEVKEDGGDNNPSSNDENIIVE